MTDRDGKWGPGGARRRGLWGALALLLALALAVPARAGDGSTLIERPYRLSAHAPAAGKARGIILMLHGGGWRGDLGERADVRMAPWIERHTQAGFRVANLAYRSGAPSYRDALTALERVRSRWPGEPVCLWGLSAGAHLALMVAARTKNEVSCVVDFSGPPSLREWGRRPGARHGLRMAIAAFGRSRLAAMSPARHARAIREPTLVLAAQCDRIIAPGIQQRFVERIRARGGDARLSLIKPGREVRVPHCDVAGPSYRDALRAEKRFLMRHTRPG